MLAFVLFSLLQKVLALFVLLSFRRRTKQKIFQVYIAEDRNFLAPERHLLELFFRADDEAAVQLMLAQFKEKFYYPKYYEPTDIGWVGRQIFMFTPRAHNVIWRELGPNGAHCFYSCNIADLHEFKFPTPRPH